MQQAGYFDYSAANGGQMPQFTLAATPAGYSNVHIPAIAPSPAVFAPLKPAFAFSIPSVPISSLSSRSSSSRIVNSAEKRANHNAIERARRDSLNNRFLEIAECIPQLKELKKPSKSIIMAKTLDYVKNTQRRFEAQQKEILALKKENQALRDELNALKGLPKSSTPTESGATSASSDQSFDPTTDHFKVEEPYVTFDSFFDRLDNDHMEHANGSLASSENHTRHNSNQSSPQGGGVDDFRLDDEFDDLLSERSGTDNFDFDYIKERVEIGLSGRHDKDWLVSQGIMRDGNKEFQEAQHALDFKMKQRNLTGKLSSRPSLDDLIDLHIMEP